MRFPEYFSQIPTIVVHDPLAELLGAPADGLLQYSFADAVKLAGHACPTVAGAWLTTTGALKALYGDELPQRGDIAVAFAASQDSGVTGVIASIATLLTGAAGDGGFAGLGGRYRRRGLLQFAAEGIAEFRFTRRDNGRSADCRLDLGRIPGDPRSGELLGAILGGAGGPGERQQFAELWQARVRRILLDGAQTPGLLEIRVST